ncbi:hypothetical protein EYF80_018992 [Xyrichtys novacula]|uniref:Uncharacterized protein n=1 Tax=Xyrichtys novacula TaxID=13765 RepID=A0AAV1GBT5_XYRNO|nr:hypothetical protein EYF80_018992 [Xyrichtys novacula]
MDIYHPVVLFKFSTKRGPSPLLSPPRAADAAFIVGRKSHEGTQSEREEEREEERGKASRQSVSTREPRRKDGSKRGKAGVRSSPPAPQPLFVTIRRCCCCWLEGIWSGENAHRGN